MRSFRIIIVSHGPIAQALATGAAMICGTLEDVEAIGFEPGESPESLAERLQARIRDADRPVLVLTDLQGGSPNNVTSLVCRETGAYCISGVNLGLLLEAIMSGDALSDGLVDRLIAIAREGMQPVSPRASIQRG